MSPVEMNEEPTVDAEGGKVTKYRSPGGVWETAFVLSTLAGIILGILQIFLIHPILTNAYLYLLLGCFLPQVFVFFPANKRAPRDRVPVYDVVLFFLTLFFCIYLAHSSWDIIHQGWAFLAPIHVSIISFIFCLVIMETVRRAGGLILWAFTGIFAVYPLFASHVPGILKGNAYPFWQVVRYHILSTDSVIGIPTQVVGTLVLGYLIFGAALVATGGGKFFLDFASALLGAQQGGPAKVAILSSGFFGSLAGSPISNIITTGSITIPTMKKIGYPSEYAAAVEACASSGGNLMPPVMGAVAFVMASFLNVPYVQVAFAAAIPSFLYYLGLYMQVDFFARRTGLRGLPKSEIPNLIPVLQDGFIYIFSFFLLLYLLYLRKEAQAPFYTTLALLVMAMVRAKTRLSPRDLTNFIKDAGLLLTQLSPMLAGCGFILGAFSMTGVATSLSREFVLLAGSNVLLMLICGAAASFVLGMGITVTACYIFLSIILVPGLIKMGNLNIMAVHLFVLYWAVVSWITPPVALGSYLAAGIAKADPMKTGFKSMRLGMVKYIIPFFFVYSPALIMQGTAPEVFHAFITASIGIFLMAGGLEAYMFGLGALRFSQRVIIFCAGFLLAMPNWLTDLIGLGLFAAAVGMHLIIRKSRAH